MMSYFQLFTMGTLLEPVSLSREDPNRNNRIHKQASILKKVDERGPFASNEAELEFDGEYLRDRDIAATNMKVFSQGGDSDAINLNLSTIDDYTLASTPDSTETASIVALTKVMMGKFNVSQTTLGVIRTEIPDENYGLEKAVHQALPRFKPRIDGRNMVFRLNKRKTDHQRLPIEECDVASYTDPAKMINQWLKPIMEKVMPLVAIATGNDSVLKQALDYINNLLDANGLLVTNETMIPQEFGINRFPEITTEDMPSRWRPDEDLYNVFLLTGKLPEEIHVDANIYFKPEKVEWTPALRNQKPNTTGFLTQTIEDHMDLPTIIGHFIAKGHVGPTPGLRRSYSESIDLSVLNRIQQTLPEEARIAYSDGAPISFRVDQGAGAFQAARETLVENPAIPRTFELTIYEAL